MFPAVPASAPYQHYMAGVLLHWSNVHTDLLGGQSTAPPVVSDWLSIHSAAAVMQLLPWPSSELLLDCCEQQLQSWSPDPVLVGLVQHDLIRKTSLLLDQALSELNALSLLACPLFMQRGSLNTSSSCFGTAYIMQQWCKALPHRLCYDAQGAQ